MDVQTSAERRQKEGQEGKWKGLPLVQRSECLGHVHGRRMQSGKEKHYGTEDKSDKRKLKFSKALQAVTEDEGSTTETEE